MFRTVRRVSSTLRSEDDPPVAPPQTEERELADAREAVGNVTEIASAVWRDAPDETKKTIISISGVSCAAFAIFFLLFPSFFLGLLEKLTGLLLICVILVFFYYLLPREVVVISTNKVLHGVEVFSMPVVVYSSGVIGYTVRVVRGGEIDVYVADEDEYAQILQRMEMPCSARFRPENNLSISKVKEIERNARRDVGGYVFIVRPAGTSLFGETEVAVRLTLKRSVVLDLIGQIIFWYRQLPP